MEQARAHAASVGRPEMLTELARSWAALKGSVGGPEPVASEGRASRCALEEPLVAAAAQGVAASDGAGRFAQGGGGSTLQRAFSFLKRIF